MTDHLNSSSLCGPLHQWDAHTISRWQRWKIFSLSMPRGEDRCGFRETCFLAIVARSPVKKMVSFEVIDRVECDASKIHVVGIGIILIRRWYRKLKFNSRVAGRVGHRTGLYQLSREQVFKYSSRSGRTMTHNCKFLVKLHRWKLTKNRVNFSNFFFFFWVVSFFYNIKIIPRSFLILLWKVR